VDNLRMDCQPKLAEDESFIRKRAKVGAKGGT